MAILVSLLDMASAWSQTVVDGKVELLESFHKAFILQMFRESFFYAEGAKKWLDESAPSTSESGVKCIFATFTLRILVLAKFLHEMKFCGC